MNNVTNTSIAYQVIDIQTKTVVKEYPAGKGQVARNYANKKDLHYGAIRYVVKLV